ncbi:MAG: transcriptional regulator [Comamonadaceae bacterium]|nr:MAG: transcriptional regulator [Comamonadaceae bacterium]
MVQRLSTMSFARTKIQLPRFRADQIGRLGLERRLGAAMTSRRLVLLVAPAGYGKTAALSRQIQLLPSDHASAWVTVDEEDDLSRFLLCLAEALEPYDPPWRTAPAALAGLAAQPNGTRIAAETLVAVLEALPVTHGVIALDDLHCIGDPRVFEFLSLLLTRLPAQWTMAIATRLDPPFSVAQLGVRRELAEFRQSDLGFSKEEVQLLCDAVGVDAAGERARVLYERTQGWAAGVCLGLSTTDPIHVAADRRLGERHLFDYLATEVFAQMQPELRQFMMRCSVLPELSIVACHAVTGHPRTVELLEEIERRGLFVSVLDSDEFTLRLHDLFRDFLEDRLRREHPEEVTALLERAAEVEVDTVRKINLLLRAGAWDRAEQTLAQATPSMLAQGSSAQLIRLVRQFPPAERETSAELSYIAGLCAWHEFEDLAVVACMRRAARAFIAQGRIHKAQAARALEATSLFFLGRLTEADHLVETIRAAPLEGEAAALMAQYDFHYTAYAGPPLAPADEIDRMVGLLTAGASAELWYRCLPRLYLMVGRVGTGGPLRRFVEGALSAATEQDEPVQVATRVLDACQQIWLGRLPEANAALERLRAQSRWLGQPRSVRVPLLRVTAIYHAMRGDGDGVRGACEALVSDISAPMLHPDWGVNMATVMGRLAAAAGDWALVERATSIIDDPRRATSMPHLLPAMRMLRARVALHERRDAEALATLRELVIDSANADRMGSDASVRLFLAVAELRAGQPAAAWQALSPVASAVGQSGEIGNVLLAGVALLEELAQADWTEAVPPHVPALMRAWRDLARGLRAPAAARGPEAATDAMADAQLSARELEVLSLLAAGHSNKAIARMLELSPHTIKRHVARILDRLAVSSRGQAAAWYLQRTPN